MSSRTFAIMDARVSFCFARTHFFSSCPSALPPLALIFYGETMPSSKVLDYANAFAPSVSKAVQRRARGFASRISEVLCKNDLERVQRFDQKLGSRHGDIMRSQFSTSWLSDVTDPYRCRLTVSRIASIPTRSYSSRSYFLRALQVYYIYIIHILKVEKAKRFWVSKNQRSLMS